MPDQPTLFDGDKVEVSSVALTGAVEAPDIYRLGEEVTLTVTATVTRVVGVMRDGAIERRAVLKVASVEEQGDISWSPDEVSGDEEPL